MTVAASSLRSLFEEQKKYIQAFFQHLDLDEVENVVKLCLNCSGLVVVTGVGKSGIIAEKIAMTLLSTGTKALYLPAVHFLHGDIGGIGEEDIVILLSKSGQTKELLELIPHMKKKRSTLVAVTSDQKSPLAHSVENRVFLHVEKELCPFDLAPTTSTTTQLLFGDLLAMALMKEKGFQVEEYAQNHPSGSIGKNITYKVKDLMKVGEEIPFCGPKARLVDVIVELSNKQCGCLLIVSKERELLGIFTDGDLRRALQKKGAGVMEEIMEDLMHTHPIVVSPEELIHTAKQKMQTTRYVMMAPVIEKERVVGLIHMHTMIHKEN